MTVDKLRIWRRKSRNSRQTGFSLIEIMVVLVVLLIGILAVVRIFPAGFLGIARTGEITTGMGLAQAQIDTMKAQANRAEAVLSEFPTNTPGVYTVNSNILPSSLLDLATGDASIWGLDPWYFSNVNQIRNIIGETANIPVPTTNTGDGTNGVGYGAIYPLQYGPVENAFTGTADSILVYGSSLQRTEQSSIAGLSNPTGTATLRNEAEYAIDYDHLKIAYFPRLIDASRPVAYRLFTISYDYYTLTGVSTIGLQYQPNTNESPAANTIIQVPDVSANPDGSLPAPVWQPLFNSAAIYAGDPTFAPLLTAGYIGMPVPTTPALYLGPPNAFPPAANAAFAYGLSHESDDVSRKFRLALPNNTVAAGGTPVWSNNDPYEYAWYSSQNPGNTANPGVLIFNPSGHNQPQVSSNGTQALRFRVDYRIYDNHVIRDDRSVPSTAPYNISLSVPYLKLGGDVLDNQNPLNNYNASLNPYNGIYRDANNLTPDIVIYNVNTGQEVGDWTNDFPIGTPNPTPGTGVLTVNTTTPGPTYDPNDPTPVNQKTGVITLNAAVVQSMGLASASLRIYYRTQKDWGMQVQMAAAHYRETTTAANVDFRHYFVGNGTTGSATRIYFAPCDAGKSVILGEFYVSLTASAPPGTSTGPIRNQTLQITENQSQFDNVGGTLLPYVDITTISQYYAGLNAVPTGRTVNNVQGISVKSRVVWQDSGRWRYIDNDSNLVQTPGQ